MDVSHRIWEGMDAKPYEFPWFVKIDTTEIKKERSHCGGTIITDNWILTAKHCLKHKYPGIEGPDLYPLIKIFTLGKTSHRFYIKKIVKHKVDHIPGHHSNVRIRVGIDHHNDLAMIETNTSMKQWDVTPICMTRREYTDQNFDATFIGLGNTAGPGVIPPEYPVNLQKKNVSFYGCTHKCKGCYCSRADNQPTGDSGSPVMINEYISREKRYKWFFVGLLSGGARESWGYENVYTDVTYFMSWIVGVLDGRYQ